MCFNNVNPKGGRKNKILKNLKVGGEKRENKKKGKFF